MKKGKLSLTIGIGIILTAVVWGAVMIGCSLKLKGTGCYQEIQNLLAVGTFINIMILGGIAGSLNIYNKPKTENK